MSDKPLYGVSLFSGAGIGDVGFRAAGVSFLSTCELEDDRASLAKINFPEARNFAGDIVNESGALCAFVAGRLTQAQDELFLLTCTAPCQGMSKNGKGTLLSNIRKGMRPKLDPRNRLILPGLAVIERLRPRWVVFENVVEMRDTVIEDDGGRLRPILEIIEERLRPHGYVGAPYGVEFANYGIPQRRQRLITVFTRDPNGVEHLASGGSLIPPATHARNGQNRLCPWVSVNEALEDFPVLDGRDEATAICEGVPFHYVPVLDPKKYHWIKHAPSGKSAFDNQCINPQCGFQGNPTHGASHGTDGVNRAHKHTPLHCEKCHSLLPRPYTEEADGRRRIMSGYTSAYKRMDGSLPSPALTRNLSYPCSDQKVHPAQNRVLSLAEAMRLQTLDRYHFQWGPISFSKGSRTITKPVAPDGLIRLVIGESVPPFFLELLGRHIVSVSNGSVGHDRVAPKRVVRKALQTTFW